MGNDVEKKEIMNNEMEIRIEPIQTPAIAWNYDQVRELIGQITRRYTGMIYTDDDIKIAKDDRAELRKLKKALNDERLKQERAYMQPFQVFKGQVKELIEMIDEPVEMIDTQVKAYEDRQREEKRKEIEAAIVEAGLEKYAGLVFDEGWLKSGRNLKRIKADLQREADKIEAEIKIINQQLTPEYAAVALEIYDRTLSLTEAFDEAERLQKANELMEQKRKEIEAAKSACEPEIHKEGNNDPTCEPDTHKENDPTCEPDDFPCEFNKEEAQPFPDIELGEMPPGFEDDVPDLFENDFSLKKEIYTIRVTVDPAKMLLLRQWMIANEIEYEIL